MLLIHIIKINKITKIITTIAGNGGGYNGENIQATSAMLNGPRDVCVDLNGNFYIADTSNYLIRKVDASTKIIKNLIGNGRFGFSGDNGLATNASISNVHSLTLDPQQENLYFTDTENYRIRKVNLLTNIITTFAGTEKSNFYGEPYGLRFDKNGIFLYFSSLNSYRIRKINMATNIVSTIAGNGVYGYNGENIAATSSKIGNVHSLTIDAIGNVFFTVFHQNIIQKVDSDTGFIFNFF
jgi:sugar lactone lactonase YvrE